MSDIVTIHYRRPPDRVETFRQRVVEEHADVIVTLADDMRMDDPMRIDDRVALEAGSSAVWFTFPDGWHDIGRFHRADGTFTGLYANVLTPVDIDGRIWHTTDLYLDVWWPEGGNPSLRDREEFDEAVRDGLVGREDAARAVREAQTIMEGAARGTWPPAVVAKWTLERVRSDLPTR